MDLVTEVRLEDVIDARIRRGRTVVSHQVESVGPRINKSLIALEVAKQFSFVGSERALSGPLTVHCSRILRGIGCRNTEEFPYGY